MNEDDKTLLEETAKLAKQNNKMLKSMRREAMISKVFHSIKWIIILATIVWSYLFIQPYLSQIQEIYTGVKGAQQSMSDLQGKVQIDTNQIENFLKSFNVGN